MIIEFTIPGRIKGKGRPRASVRKGFVRMYTDEKTRSDEALVRHYAREAMAERRAYEGALSLDVLITLNTPPSWSKRRRAETKHGTGKPDLDNIVKLIGDALNGIVWRDDAQLCDVRIRRLFDDSAPESVRVRIAAPARLSQLSKDYSLTATPLFAPTRAA